MNKKSNNNLKKIFIDKILLILSAIVLGLGILAFLFLLFKINLSEEWRKYILISITYFVAFSIGINKLFGFKKKVTNLVYLLLFLFYAVSPILMGFVILYYKLLPFPKRTFTYLILGLILLPTAAVCFDKSLKYLEGRNRFKNKQ